MNVRLFHITFLLALHLHAYTAFAQQTSVPKASSAQQMQQLADSGLKAMFAHALKAAQSGNLPDAIQEFTTILQRVPNHIPSLSNRASLYFQMNNTSAAIEDATKILALAPGMSKMYFVRGASYLNLQRLPEAEKDLEIAVKLDPNNVHSYKILGTVYTLLQKYDKAIMAWTSSIKLAPQEDVLYYERANAFANLQRHKEAILDYDAALKNNPNNFSAYLNRANTRAAIHDYTGAIQDYSILIEKFPTNIKYLANRGIVYGEMLKYDEAISDLTKVLELDSMIHRVRIHRARTFLERGKPAQCIEDCTTLLRLNPQDAAGFTNAGNGVAAYLQREDFLNADAYMIRALARAALGDTTGACLDAEHSAELGSSNTNTLRVGICQVRTFQPAPNFPESYQLYPRNKQDSAMMPINAMLQQTGFDSAFVILRKNGAIVSRMAHALNYLGTLSSASSAVVTRQAHISFNAGIHAESEEYSFSLGVKNASQTVILAERTNIVCGDVFLASGQSNVILGEIPQSALSQPYQYVRTFTMNDKDSYWGVASAKANDVYNIGAMAYMVAVRLSKQANIPIALINGGLSGSTIEQHFRDNANPAQLRSWYGRMLWRVKRSGLADAAKAMLWYQGESNGSAGYAEKFISVHNGWKQDYPSLRKVYVVQIRPSECNQSPQDTPREEQRTLGTRSKDIEVAAAAAVPLHDGCHYGNDGYIVLGNNLARLIARDFYKSTDTLGISSPNLLKAAWTSPKHDEIALSFATNDSLVCGADTSVGGKIRTLANDAFLLDGKPARAVSVRSVEKNTVLLKFATPIAEQNISYVPEKCYAGSPEAPCVVYEGPWITTRRGVGALTFANVPIQAAP